MCMASEALRPVTDARLIFLSLGLIPRSRAPPAHSFFHIFTSLIQMKI